MSVSATTIDSTHQSGQVASQYRAFGTLRFALALLVAQGHARSFAPEALQEQLAAWAAGTIGVLVFFVLSGFIISESLQTFYRSRVQAFLANRLLRIVPPYLMALVISIALHGALITTPPDAFAIRTLLHQFPLLFISWGPEPPSYYFVRYVWAVSVEFWFYVIYAIVFFALLKWVSANRGYIAIVFAALLVAYAARRSGISWIYPLWMAPYFLLGISLYLHATTRSLEAAIAVALCSLAVGWHVYDWYGRVPHGIGAGVAVLALSAIVVWLSDVRLSASSKKIDQMLGDLSYPLYLNHFVVLQVFNQYALQRGLQWWLIFGAASTALAVLANLIVEPRMHDLRTRLRGREV